MRSARAIRRRRDPGRRRIALIRWTTTLVFAATTAACLAILVTAALHIDLTSRAAAVDSDLRQRVSTLADLVHFSSDHQLHLGNVDESNAATTAPVYGFVTDTAIVYAKPGQSSLPSDDRLRQALSDARHSAGTAITFTAPASRGGPALHWAAATIVDFDTYVDGGYTGGIAIAGAPVEQAPDYVALRFDLMVAAGSLTVLAALLGHLIAGLAVRPAVRGLAAQEQFLLEASRELRTPLSTLRVLAERGAPPSRILGQVDRLSTVTDQLLARARATTASAPAEREDIRLDQLVEQIIRENPPGDLATELHPSVVSANAELTTQIVLNLVQNAVRHGEPPLTVVVADHFLEIRDCGRGIPSHLRRRAVRAGATRGEGTGTGLAIASWACRVQQAKLLFPSTSPRQFIVRVEFAGPSSKPHEPGSSVEGARPKGQ